MTDLVTAVPNFHHYPLHRRRRYRPVSVKLLTGRHRPANPAHEANRVGLHVLCKLARHNVISC